jgi:simple sugar transport system ATP-binding protein
MPPAGHSAPAIELRGIGVRFGAVEALRDVSLDLSPGERHAIVGENGAGKSTLMRVIFGLLPPDTGQIVVAGEPRAFTSPADAIALGVGMVQQHFELVATLTVSENVTLGREVTRRGGAILDRTGADDAVRRLSEQSGLPIDPRARVADLSVAAQQRVEILKALYRDARVLILDEPTAVLSPAEARELWDTTERLADKGATVVFVTHKLDEVMANADRVTVLRRGERVFTARTAETTAGELAAAMVGGAAIPVPDSAPSSPGHRPPAAPNGAAGLSLRDVSVAGPRGVAADGVTLDVASGEIVGLAGIDGSGQVELVEAILGLRPIHRGAVRVGGEEITSLPVADRRRRGIAFIPEDRHRRGLVLPFSCEENVILGRHKDARFTWAGRFLRRGAMRAFLEERTIAFDVRGALPGVPARSLSGGNQQKLVLARELATAPRVILASQPTRGLDFAASAFVHAALLRERDRGAAILLHSLDLDEILALSDRIAVMLRGRVVATLDRAAANATRVGAVMTGAGT